MIRTFLAIELSEPLRVNLLKLQQELKQRLVRELSRDIRISWVQPTSIHLTIKFLGDIDEQLVVPMQDAMSQVVQGHHAIHIPLERLGVFPRLQQPRVLWVGPSEQWERDEDAKRLALLHQGIEACCRALDFAPESRPLSPHLTLARIKEGGRSMGQVLAKSGVMDRSLDLGSLAVGAIELMKSELKPAGSVYTRLWEVKLDR
jgi:RNA 2',3'-cyclic 3'-phosphodiesterase